MNGMVLALALLGLVGPPFSVTAAERREVSPGYDRLADAPKEGHHGRFTLRAGLSSGQGLVLSFELQLRDDADLAADSDFRPVWRTSVGFQLSRGVVARGGKGGLGWYYLLSVPNRSIACTFSTTGSPRANEAWQKFTEAIENGD